MLLRLTTRVVVLRLSVECWKLTQYSYWFLFVSWAWIPNNLEALDKTEIYLRVMGWSRNHQARNFFKDSDILGEKINGEPGLGLKIGLFTIVFAWLSWNGVRIIWTK
ncbi:MAG: hypothetical protein H6749_04200 [Nitrospiraceae bacterium]|nr:hypothetical protein [Nitrospiraceae bacterium]